MKNREEAIVELFAAELQFRLASAVNLAVAMEVQPLDLPISWAHGKHVVEYKEVALRDDQADYAAWHLHQSATFLMAVAIKDAIKIVHPHPRDHADRNIKNAYQIARLIRNAFAHGPFGPVWSVEENCRKQLFEIKDVITLDTKNLQGHKFDWRHYGGPLALLKLCQFVRFEILGDAGTKPKDRIVPEPKITYLQQGDLILKKIANLDN